MKALPNEQTPTLTPKRGEVRNISRHLLVQMSGDLTLVKAVAMSIYLKNRHKGGRIERATTNKLHNLTRLHASTVTKYLETLTEHDLIRWEKQSLVFTSLTDRHHNVKLPPTGELSIKELENMLLAMLIVDILRQKEYVRRTIEAAYNPLPSREALKRSKGARRICRERGYGREYKEYGLSYKTIARRLGISLQKAEEVVAYAVNNGIMNKEKRQEQYYMHHIGGAEKFVDLAQATFCTKNNVYKVFANVYILPPTG